MPGALREHAERLCALARRVEVLYLAVGAVLGFVGAVVGLCAVFQLLVLDPFWEWETASQASGAGSPGTAAR